MKSEPLPIAEALRLIRTRKGLTQTAASKLPGAPDFRTLSHWETRRKLPSLKLLYGYLTALDLDFSDLQEAIDQVRGDVSKATARRFAGLEQAIDGLAGTVEELESRSSVLDGFDEATDLGDLDTTSLRGTELAVVGLVVAVGELESRIVELERRHPAVGGAE